MRKLKSPWDKIVMVLCIALVVFQIYTVFGMLPDLIKRSIHLGFVLTLSFILIPFSKKQKGSDKVPVYDIILAVISAVTVIFLVANYNTLIWNPLQWLGPIDKALAVILVILVLEASRRSVGLIFPALALVFFAYALYGPYFPGVWGHKPYSVDLIFQTLYHSTNGIWGTMISISAGMLAMFGIFGAMLSETGGAGTFVKLGQKLTGKTIGGQGKVALIASGLFGMISGSAMANVVGTGTFTIPLMKKSGYNNEWAAAISAVGSTGGTIMPPMMGAGAFIMAQLLGVSYLEIAKAALIPALLYYVGAYIAVHYISKKDNIRGEAVTESIDKAEYLVIFTPIAFFLYYLLRGYTATMAAFYATVAGFIVALLFKVFKAEKKSDTPKICINLFTDVSVSAGKSIVNMATLMAGSQITICLISLTGFGVKLSSVIVQIGQDNLFLCLVLTMLVCIVLGMGLPATAAYVLSAAILAPVLTTLGVPILVAHLFIFYFAGFSTITPPVCAAVYLASGLAKSNWFKTGILSCMIALPAFVVPYTFIYDTSLLLMGSIGAVAIAVITAFLGVWAIGAGVAGYIRAKISLPFRILAVVAGILLVIPNLTVSILGLVLFAVVYVWNFMAGKKVKEAVNA
ncbi:TRAP transporter fused permease subunit [Clostridium sp. AM58-1XD]|uniref:TRAP transporter permease n=1 Tax=Clostridium sp. AM58-1XD TaxID=2292307 RepID=UPI000E4981C2|nr:TRAP transporter fused permease subunit [Clostridium sp. AM58-1XD]RGY98091.1 C4-dicarboxylate ABC transporter [Clostridium sp. AM58-1XD]